MDASQLAARFFTFALLFGMGPAGLKAKLAADYRLTLSEKEAARYREAWFESYPAFAAWQKNTETKSRRTLQAVTPGGRVRRFTAAEYKATEAYSMPVQGAGAEILQAALGQLIRKINEAGVNCLPINAVHDEVILEASSADAPAAKMILEQALIAGFLDVLPQAPTRGLVEARIVCDWSKK